MGLSMKEPRMSTSLGAGGSQHVKQCDTSENAQPAIRPLDGDQLIQDNIKYMGSCGVSGNNREQGFRAAFRDEASGVVALARDRDGLPAPMHLLDGLPEDWVLERSDTGKVVSVKASVVAGFVRRGRFYTREEAAQAADDWPYVLKG
ncbi:hypothetical protein [Aquisalimonas sp.]|uniref:hypothetical protein n=1 Tax=Aquisalimonas sp. TaxID=1872621 RepID=UPI0025BFABE7|nr:hypothetical protein [Aquisalimonas sp.]